MAAAASNIKGNERVTKCHVYQEEGNKKDQIFMGSIKLTTCMASALGIEYLSYDKAVASQNRIRNMIKHPGSPLQVQTIDVVQELKLSRMSKRLDRYQELVGRSSCAQEGKGLHGGFCLDNGDTTTDSGKTPLNSLDKGFALGLAELFAGDSVIDVGCGLGLYGHFFIENFPGVRQKIEWQGIDNSIGIEEATNNFVKFMDITEPIISTEALEANWVMSINGENS